MGESRNAAGEAEQRAQRLAARLRENLKRRKAQARSRRAGEGDDRGGLPAAAAPRPDDSSASGA